MHLEKVLKVSVKVISLSGYFGFEDNRWVKMEELSIESELSELGLSLFEAARKRRSTLCD